MHEEVIMAAFQASRVICWGLVGGGLLSLVALAVVILVGPKKEPDYNPMAVSLIRAFWASLWLWYTWGIVV